MICKKDHRYLTDLENLPDGQGGPGRHKCAGCAYEMGYNDAKEGKSRSYNADLLDDSQAGAGRHKDTEAAYNLGYENFTS